MVSSMSINYLPIYSAAYLLPLLLLNWGRGTIIAVTVPFLINIPTCLNLLSVSLLIANI